MADGIGPFSPSRANHNNSGFAIILIFVQLVILISLVSATATSSSNNNVRENVGKCTQQIKLTLNFTGGQSNCQGCQTGTMQPNYACQSGDGQWNRGAVIFNNPIPQQHAICGLNLRMIGLWSCVITTGPATANVVLQHTVINTTILPQDPPGCGCRNCMVPFEFGERALDPDNGLPQYNYAVDGLNTLQIISVGNSICLSRFELTLNYSEVIPRVTAVYPIEGLTTGGTDIYATVSNYAGGPTPAVCRFGTALVNATQSYNNTIHCKAPSRNRPGVVPFAVSFDGDVFSEEAFSFTYVDPPTPDSVESTIKKYLGWIVAAGVVVGFMFILAVVMLWYLLYYRKRGNVRMLDVLTKIGTLNDAERENLLINTAGFTSAFEEIDSSEVELGGRIGKGSFAEVFKGKWRGTDIAVKKMPAHCLGAEFFSDFEREANLMKGLRHPNILQFFGACLVPPDICIIMEYMPRGSLYRILHSQSNLPWDLLLHIALDTARGMNYLHRSEPQVLHRDLKSHNLLVDENWKVKVCDFGLSRIVEQTLSATMTSCGTPCWTAPEVLRNHHYTEKCDVYSFAIVLWEMISRQDPYKGMPPFQVVFAVGTQKIRPPMPAQCPPPWSTLIVDCWDEDPSKRPHFDTIIERLLKFPELKLPPPAPPSQPAQQQHHIQTSRDGSRESAQHMRASGVGYVPLSQTGGSIQDLTVDGSSSSSDDNIERGKEKTTSYGSINRKQF